MGEFQMDKGGQYISKAFLAFLREHGTVVWMTVRNQKVELPILPVVGSTPLDPVLDSELDAAAFERCVNYTTTIIICTCITVASISHTGVM
jgi:hypothetical protein